MKITKSALKRLIKEELGKVLERRPVMPDWPGEEESGPTRKKEVPHREKYACAKQPGSKEEAQTMAIAGLKAAATGDPFEELSALTAHCISDTATGKSQGQPATQVTFKNRTRIVVLDSAWR
jgi:hypothetical protein